MIETLNSIEKSTKLNFRHKMNASLAALMKNMEVVAFAKFEKYLQRDDTWKFWVQFVYVDAMAYAGLYLAMCGGEWHLRMSSLKTMAPLFTAFDHPTYQKLISHHIYKLLNLPEEVLLMFTQGAFVVNISGREWHSVGIDKAHEMLINKQCKEAVVKPSEDYINRTASYLVHSTIAFEHLQKELFPEKEKNNGSDVQSVYSGDNKTETNIQSQISALTNTGFLVANREKGLINPFTGEKAQNEKYQHLMHFREIGQEEYQLRISYHPKHRSTQQKKSTANLWD